MPKDPKSAQAAVRSIGDDIAAKAHYNLVRLLVGNAMGADIVPWEEAGEAERKAAYDAVHCQSVATRSIRELP